MTAPFAMVEDAVKEVLQFYPAAAGKVGKALNYSGSGLYVFIGLIPGAGGSDAQAGSWTVDIDCFGTTYRETMNHALAIEALLVGRNHKTSVMRLDNCTQNEAPSERPWDDDGVWRIGAAYTFTARRSG